ncbi:MAG: peptidoglycan editing factor PgeF, partial [Sphingopyxis sp.]
AGRRGGGSTGLIASLNCGMGAEDDPAAVAVNRRRAADAVLPNAVSSGLSHSQANAALVSVHQVHSAACVTVNEVWSDDARPHADALVTARPGILLGIVTADCVPVLLADAGAGVVGAAHAGWKGALAGVTDATVAAMEALGAQGGRIVAAIGPCIARASYEVDRTLFDAFAAADPANERFFADGRTSRVGLRTEKARQKRHWQFDLEAYVAARLATAGVRQVEAMGLDTYARTSDFYSYRRATHRGEPTYGRQLSMIGVPQ